MTVLAGVSAVSAADSIPAPHIEYGALSPLFVVFGAAVLGVLVEAFAPRAARWGIQVGLSLLGLVGAFVAVVLVASGDDWKGADAVVAEGAVTVDGPALFLQGTVLLLALVAVLLLAERRLDPGPSGAFAAQASTVPGSPAELEVTRAGAAQTEVFPLTLFAVGGMLLFPAANDLLVAFVALEVLSLPLYLLCGLARRRRLLSQEAAMKYFLLGAFSSAFFLYGVALLYGYAGSVRLSEIADATSQAAGSDVLLLSGVALVTVGLLFKAGAAPFHAWTPDVYQGAPTAVTAFMAACTKVAAFGALLRIYYVAFGGLRWEWRPLMWGVAILTMLVGAVISLTQQDVKRMLAYSSIAHAGFVLVGVLAADDAGLRGVLFYLLAYGFATIGAFAVVTMVRDPAGEATHLSQWAGLGRRSPLVAGAFALFLLSFAGIPLTSGFMSKYAVFSAALDGGASPVVIVAVLASVVAAFFYVRVIVLMFFSEPAADGPTVAVPSILTTVALALGVTVTLVLGVIPQPVLDLAGDAAAFVR
ncbi:NADH-quinone oxidoreductase subunit NuoN [Motilibacter aurantiacus]|uniref:NADH-quinone oxidoreductase subunit NuoN n=1 Tax=Motilibacter aurantiacus TaxID=2714955 RepID=UPI00140817C9|nr:NADH-quinone oxidoreductase subunit NuoN [Motilibacter aurantiacus]NHC44120.1 NADH-quinone oxidoreductase subunit NuoN [Motilibacter aurantiacus]